jgi:hypothetical protein
LPLIIAARAAVCGAHHRGLGALNPCGRVYDPFVTLGWITGWTERIGLGSSIVLVPLHHRMQLAKEIATLQERSGERFTLGVGMVVVPRCDIGAAPVAAAGRSGWRQLRARYPAGARAGRRDACRGP